MEVHKIMSFAKFSKSENATKTDKSVTPSSKPKDKVFGPDVEKPLAENSKAKP